MTDIPAEIQVFDPSVYEQPTLEELVAEAERKAKAAAATAKKLNSTASTGANKAKDGDKPKAEKKSKKKEEGENTSVYLRGLPRDVTVEEIYEWAKKAGVIKKNSETEEPLVKLYNDESGKFKGDGLVVYLFPESIKQAILLLDEDHIKPGFPVRVEEAKFQDVKSAEKAGGAGVDAKKGKIKRRKKVLTTAQQKEQALDWDEPLYKKRHVVIKHLFDAKTVDPSNFTFYTDLANELREEVTQLGPIESLKVFENSPEGVAVIKFADWLGADRCIRGLNDRFFDGRKLIVEYYDGKTNYAVAEDAAARAARDESFAKWLGEDDDDNEGAAATGGGFGSKTQAAKPSAGTSSASTQTRAASKPNSKRPRNDDEDDASGSGSYSYSYSDDDEGDTKAE